MAAYHWVCGKSCLQIDYPQTSISSSDQCPLKDCIFLQSGIITVVKRGLCVSAITARKRRCITAVGTRATAPSSVSRSTGMSSTSECVGASATDSISRHNDAQDWCRTVANVTDCVGSVTGCFMRMSGMLRVSHIDSWTCSTNFQYQYFCLLLNACLREKLVCDTDTDCFTRAVKAEGKYELYHPLHVCDRKHFTVSETNATHNTTILMDIILVSLLWARYILVFFVVHRHECNFEHHVIGPCSRVPVHAKGSSIKDVHSEGEEGWLRCRQMWTRGRRVWLHADVRNSVGLSHCLPFWHAAARRFLSPLQWWLWLY